MFAPKASDTGAGQAPSDRLRLPQARDRGCVPTQLAEDLIGMLTERRHCIHARGEGIQSSRWQQGRNRPGWRRDLGPALACRELRVLPDIVHVVHVCVGDLRGVEPGNHFLAAEPRELLDDQRLQLGASGAAQGVAGVARIAGQLAG